MPGGVVPADVVVVELLGLKEPPQPIACMAAIPAATMTRSRKISVRNALRPRSNPSSPKNGIPSSPAISRPDWPLPVSLVFMLDVIGALVFNVRFHVLPVEPIVKLLQLTPKCDGV